MLLLKLLLICAGIHMHSFVAQGNVGGYICLGLGAIDEDQVVGPAAGDSGLNIAAAGGFCHVKDI